MQLVGKTVVVTGAGRGIGRAIAQAFGARGAAVAALARSVAEIESTRDQIEAGGGRCFAQPCDVTDRDAVVAAMAQIQERLGPIDILINNAGYAAFKPFMDLTPEEWRQTLEVNLTGVFHCCQAVIPKMMDRKCGQIINISSVSGLRPIPRQSAYCVSKHGLNGLTTTLAMELKPYNIRVHAICPGGVPTRLTEENMPDRDKSDWMSPEDVAHTALYLASLSPRATTDLIYLRRFGSVPLGG